LKFKKAIRELKALTVEG